MFCVTDEALMCCEIIFEHADIYKHVIVFCSVSSVHVLTAHADPKHETHCTPYSETMNIRKPVTIEQLIGVCFV